jgi:hypothetical protein
MSDGTSKRGRRVVSQYQPTLAEAQEQAAYVEKAIAAAYRVYPSEWREDVDGRKPKRIFADGYLVHQKGRRWNRVEWPMSRIEKRCDDCGAVLRARRDCGGSGFYYDGRWLLGDPAKADPRKSYDWRTIGFYTGRSVCLPCYNRIRPVLARSEQINENRLLIGRIQREISRVAA